MSTAQTLLTGGNQTQQVQAVTSTVPWIVLGIVAVMVAMIFLRRRQ